MTTITDGFDGYKLEKEIIKKAFLNGKAKLDIGKRTIKLQGELTEEQKLAISTCSGSLLIIFNKEWSETIIDFKDTQSPVLELKKILLTVLFEEKLESIKKEEKSLNAYGMGCKKNIEVYLSFLRDDDYSHVKGLIEGLDIERNCYLDNESTKF